MLIPNFVPPVAPAAEVRRLGRIVEGTPVQVWTAHPGRSRGRHPQEADAEDPPAKALQPVATSLRQVAGFVQEYTA